MAWILVTGAAKGFGRQICIELAKKKHSIVIHYKESEKEALETAKECRKFHVRSEILQGDFETQESTQNFIEKYLDAFSETKGIVNNVGNYLICPLAETTNKEWTSLFQTNLHAPLHLIHALLPSLKKAQGSVVNIGSSGLNANRAKQDAPAYAITKVALLNATVSFAKELAPYFVRFNMISPGYLETAVDLKDPNKLPMKRAATLAEAAQLVAFFFEKEAEYITGQNIEIAGGFGL